MTILAQIISDRLKNKEGIYLHETLIDQILRHRNAILKEDETTDRLRGIYEKTKYVTLDDGRKVKIAGED